MARNEPLSKGEKRLLIASIAFVIIIGAFGWWYHAINVDPIVHFPPSPPLPNPNARDVFLAAAKLQVQSLKKPATKRTFRVSDINNFIQAGNILPQPKTSFPPPSLAEMKALVAKNAAAIAKARQGLAYAYGSPPLRSNPDGVAEYLRLRLLAYAMQADGDVKCATGDWDGAVERYVDVIHFGTVGSHGEAFYFSLWRMRNAGWSDTWATLDHVSAAEARRAARRLEKIAGQRTPLAVMLEEEKWETQAEMIKLFREPNWRKDFGNDLSLEGEQARDYLLQRFVSKRAVIRHISQYMDALIADAKKPYPLNVKTSYPLRDPMSQAVLSGKSMPFSYIRMDVFNDLLMVSFALRAYKADHNAYPASLHALAPAYLKAVPADPFSTGMLKYKKTGESYILYSVGPDGRDDGGQPSADGTASTPGPSLTSAPSYLSEASTGDIVAGVNLH